MLIFKVTLYCIYIAQEWCSLTLEINEYLQNCTVPSVRDSDPVIGRFFLLRYLSKVVVQCNELKETISKFQERGPRCRLGAGAWSVNRRKNSYLYNPLLRPHLHLFLANLCSRFHRREFSDMAYECPHGNCRSQHYILKLCRIIFHFSNIKRSLFTQNNKLLDK